MAPSAKTRRNSTAKHTPDASAFYSPLDEPIAKNAANTLSKQEELDERTEQKERLEGAEESKGDTEDEAERQRQLQEVQNNIVTNRQELQILRAETGALAELKVAENNKRSDSDSSAEEIQADPLAPRLSPAAVIARWTTYLPA